MPDEDDMNQIWPVLRGLQTSETNGKGKWRGRMVMKVPWKVTGVCVYVCVYM